MSDIYFPNTLHVAAFSMNITLFGINAMCSLLRPVKNIIKRNKFVLQPLIESKDLCTANYTGIKHRHLSDT